MYVMSQAVRDLMVGVVEDGAIIGGGGAGRARRHEARLCLSHQHTAQLQP